MTAWKWSDQGEPSLDIMPGYEITPLRLGDGETWARLDPDWKDDSIDKEDLKQRCAKGVKRRCEDVAPWIKAFRKGEPVPNWNAWMARDKSNGLAVSRVWFNDKSDEDAEGTRNMGWGTLPEYQRKGISKTAVIAVLKEFVPLMEGVHTITANPRADNIASLGVIRSAGFEKIGETPAEHYPGHPELIGDGVVYNFAKVIRPQDGGQ